MHSAALSGRSFVEEARRAQIVDAAVRTLATVGAARASFARIAEEAGISPSLISYHFSARHELLLEIGRTIDADIREAMAEATREATSPLAAVRGLVAGFVGYVDGHRERMLALRELEATLAPDERRRIGVLDPNAGRTAWQELLHAGQAVGAFGSFDPQVVATAIMGLLSTVPAQLYGEPRIDPAVVAEGLCRIVERAVRP